MLDAALAVLVEEGVERLTMLAVARRAGASKETLYSWFGNRDGLLRALIERNADGSAERVAAALGSATPATDGGDDTEPRAVLTDYATGLLRLLTNPASVALNRAAMTDPDLAALLLAGGRHRVGPIVESFLADQAAAGRLTLAVTPAEAFELLYGLVVRDTQIRVLLGEDPPSPGRLATQAATAVDRFLLLAAGPADG